MRKSAFTLIELLVVISIIALLIGILLPALGAARRTARAMQSNTQIRGIQQGMFIFSQSNKDLYPGLDKLTNDANDALTNAGQIKTYNSNWGLAGGDVPARYIICLNADLFVPAYLVSPFESNSQVQEWVGDGTVTYTESSPIHSYALPRIRNNANMSQGRAYEWRAEANASAVVVSDRLFRNTGAAVATVAADSTTHYSLQSTEQPGQWTGGISFNDNHTETFRTSAIDVQLTYAGVRTDGPDNIFNPAQVGNQGLPASSSNQYNAQQIIRKYDTGLYPPTGE